jgi:hypothetical protein
VKADGVTTTASLAGGLMFYGPMHDYFQSMSQMGAHPLQEGAWFIIIGWAGSFVCLFLALAKHAGQAPGISAGQSGAAAARISAGIGTISANIHPFLEKIETSELHAETAREKDLFNKLMAASFVSAALYAFLKLVYFPFHSWPPLYYPIYTIIKTIANLQCAFALIQSVRYKCKNICILYIIALPVTNFYVFNLFAFTEFPRIVYFINSCLQAIYYWFTAAVTAHWASKEK